MGSNEASDKEGFTIDAIAMKRQLQEEFYETTKDLSPEELIAYIRQRIANSEFADFLTSIQDDNASLVSD